MSPNPRDLLALAQALCDFYRVAEPFAEVHAFAGKWRGPLRGERGGTYWLPEGAPDVPANRKYRASPPAPGGAAPPKAKPISSAKSRVQSPIRPEPPGLVSRALDAGDTVAERIGLERVFDVGDRIAERLGFSEVHAFAGAKWRGPLRGERGGTYWLREGAQDVEANRVYGATPGTGTRKASKDSAVDVAGDIAITLAAPGVPATLSQTSAIMDTADAVGEVIGGGRGKAANARKVEAVKQAAKSTAKAAGYATLEHVMENPAGALEFIKRLAGMVRQVVGFSEDGAGWTAEGVRRNPAGALACIERLRKRLG